MTTFKPMLAGKAPADLGSLKFPLLVSPKLDGIRCVIQGGVALSRKLLPIPNRFVQAQLAGLPDGLDGELMLDLPGSFAKVSSAVMSRDGEPDFTFCVFDRFESDTYWNRFHSLTPEQVEKWWGKHRVEKVPHQVVPTLDYLMAWEEEYVKLGFEGLMIRSMDGPYKCGRSTEREGYLLKLKRFEDAEATVVGVEELMHNDNEAKTDELGRTKRSSAKEGKRPAGMLGALICRREHDSVKFNIGAGFTEEKRRSLWSDYTGRAGSLIGLSVKYRFQPDPSAPDAAPRFPTFIGFRNSIDT